MGDNGGLQMHPISTHNSSASVNTLNINNNNLNSNPSSASLVKSMQTMCTVADSPITDPGQMMKVRTLNYYLHASRPLAKLHKTILRTFGMLEEYRFNNLVFHNLIRVFLFVKDRSGMCLEFLMGFSNAPGEIVNKKSKKTDLVDDLKNSKKKIQREILF